MTTYKDLQTQIEQLRQQAEQARQAELQAAMNDIKAKMDEYGLTVDDLRKSRKKHPTAGKSVAARYQDPATGKTWSGRGKPPTWMAGKDRAQFEIRGH